MAAYDMLLGKPLNGGESLPTKRLIIGTLAAAAAVSLSLGQTAVAAVVPVVAGPASKPKSRQLDFDAFFSRKVKIHVGDTVRWTLNGFHTVTFPAAGQELPAFVLPVATDVVSGAVDAAGNPFFFNGQPQLPINPQAAFPSGGPTYDGSSYANSGLPVGPAAGKPFSLKFTKVGTYRYFCLVHPGMTGSVTVVAKGKKVPSAAKDVRAALAGQATATRLAAKLAKVKPAPATVLVGHDKGGVAWLRFFPGKLTVKVGQPVKFEISSLVEQHTVTFGPAAVRAKLEATFVETIPNGEGAPKIVNNPIAAYPSDPPGKLPPYDGTNHGNGFENSGLLALTEGLSPIAEFTFTKPGVYHYQCEVHAGMTGTITVTS
jgi:plastocyanin